jgi:hypothetical protein
MNRHIVTQTILVLIMIFCSYGAGVIKGRMEGHEVGYKEGYITGLTSEFSTSDQWHDTSLLDQIPAMPLNQPKGAHKMTFKRNEADQ